MAGKAGVFLGRASNASFLFALQTVRNRRKDLSPRDRVTVVLENHMGGWGGACTDGLQKGEVGSGQEQWQRTWERKESSFSDPFSRCLLST